jgi:hypothetical protein
MMVSVVVVLGMPSSVVATVALVHLLVVPVAVLQVVFLVV